MNLRPAVPGDLPQLTAFLRDRVVSSMFLLSNLAAHGLDGAHSNAMRLWVAGDPVTGVAGLTNGGMILPQWPGGDWRALRRLIARRAVAGIVGEAAQVAALRRDLGLDATPARMATDEQGFALDLADLRMPDTPGLHLRPPGPDDRALMAGWRRAALEETQGVPADASQALAMRDVDGWIARGSHRLLVRGETPLAMTGFNAMLPDAVQVGGVFTPPGLRGQGHARRAVGLHLAEARAAGAVRAFLFAAHPAAIRAYAALGFAPRGRIALVIFRSRAEVRP